MKLDAALASATRVRAFTCIDAFADIWPTLAAPGAGVHFVFQKREVIKVWLDTIGAARGVRPLFVRVDAGGQPLLLLALGIERRHGVRVLTTLDGGVCDYNTPILFGPADNAVQLWRLITAALPPHDAALLGKLPAQVGGMGNPLAALAPASEPPSGHVIPLTQTWRHFESARLHRPKDSRRKRRRLMEHGALEFRVAASLDEARAMLDVLIKHKTRRYIELNGADGFERPGYRRYFREMTERLFHTGAVHVSVLTLDGAVLAAHWGLVADKRFYCLVLAHADGQHAQYSPGRLLIEHLIEWSYAQGLGYFDLGYGDAPWKAHFAPQRLPLAHIALPATPYGWAYIESRRLRDRYAAAAKEHS